MDKDLKKLVGSVVKEMGGIGRMSVDDKHRGAMRLDLNKVLAENILQGGNLNKSLAENILQGGKTSDVLDHNYFADNLQPENFNEYGVESIETTTSKKPLNGGDDRQLTFDFDRVIKSEDVYTKLEEILTLLKSTDSRLLRIEKILKEYELTEKEDTDYI